MEYRFGDAPDDVDGGVGRRALQDHPTRMLLTLAALVIIIVGMRYASGLLNPILVALFVVMGISPVLDWMRKKNYPSWLAITIVLIIILGLAAGLAAIVASQVGPFTEQVPKYEENLNDLLLNLQVWFRDTLGVDTADFFRSYVNVERIAESATTVASSVIDAFSNIFLMVLIVLFMLAQIYSFPRRRVYSRLALSQRFEQTFKASTDVIRSYLFTKGWLSLVAAVISTGIYFAFGVDFALIWGILFFVLSFIPNFGFILSIIPPFIVTLLENGFTRAILVLVVVVVMNTVVDNVLGPRYMSRSVGLSTLAVFLSLIIWAWILGPVGALISVPLTLMVKLLILDAYESTRFLSLFLTGGKEMVSTPERKRRQRLRRRRKEDA